MTDSAHRALRRAFVAAFLAAGLAVPAQTAIAAEPTPGSVQDTIQQEPPKPALPMGVAPEFERDTDPELRQPVGPSVTVERFVLTGNQSIDTDVLQGVLAAYVGQSLTLGEIYEAADALTAYYREQGYGLANVLVPAQRISSGVIRFEVIEGRIGAISMVGNSLYSFGFLNDRLQALKPGTIYRSEEMERGVLLLNDLPGLTARAVIKPGTEYGTSDILFKATEDAMEFSGTVDNYGREELGEIRLTANATFNSLTGRGDRLSITGLVSEKAALTYGNISYGIPVSADGDRVRVTFNRANYDVETGVFADLGITGDNTTYRVDWSSPWVRSRNFNIVFTTAVQRQETESFTILSTTPENATELDMLEFGLFMSGILDGGSSWSFSSLLSGNGKSNESTVADPQTDAQQAKLRVDGGFSLPFASRWLFLTRGTGVYSADPLVDSQKFSLGGPYSVRGYFPAEQRGDFGAFVSVELRRYFLAGKYPIAASVFLDGGVATTRLLPVSASSPALQADYTARSGQLASAGVGLLFAPEGSDFSGSLLFATPIDNHNEGPSAAALDVNKDDHFWATFQVKF